MEQKLSDTLVKAIDRSNPMMQNLQLASRFNKLVEQSGGVNLEDNKEVSITSNGTVEIVPTEGKDGMEKVTVNVDVPSVVAEPLAVTENGVYTASDGKAYSPVTVNVPSREDTTGFSVQCLALSDGYITCVVFPRSAKVTAVTKTESEIIAGGTQAGFAVYGSVVDTGTKISVVYDGNTYSYTYTRRDHEQHDLVKE